MGQEIAWFCFYRVATLTALPVTTLTPLITATIVVIVFLSAQVKR
jgi:hypothetical protein